MNPGIIGPGIIGKYGLVGVDGRCGLIGGGVALGASFEVSAAQARLVCLSLFLLSVDLDVELLALFHASCLYASHQDNNGLHL